MTASSNRGIRLTMAHARLQALKARSYQGHESSTANWLIGSDPLRAQAYLVHVVEPRFVAKVGTDDVGVLAPLSFGTESGATVYDFLWFDTVPPEAELRRLLLEAEQVLALRSGAGDDPL